jgi:orotidine-5'-phosphate decarboxylase
MNKKELIQQIKSKKSFLCVGLDTDLTKIPEHLLEFEDPIFEFNKQIIDATADLCVAYKPNSAFYESLGSKGWESLHKTDEYIPKGIFKIIDAKRGDIGNTSKLYAKAFFENMHFDSVTVSPYMGVDSVSPFMEYEGKWVILLALTSNVGAMDFQLLPTTSNNRKVFEKVLIRSSKWGNDENMMFVVGATKADMLKSVREIVPNHFLLIPGVGAQGGSLDDVSRYGLNQDCGLLVNASRSIIYASSGRDFAEKARQEALSIQKQMQHILENAKII